MKRNQSRRQFLEQVAVGTAAGTGLTAFSRPAAANAAAGRTLPKRILGSTGVSVSILAFGCGSRWLMYKEEDAALDALNRGINLGITYVDTAFSYGDGASETRVGKLMGARRKDIFLATKIPDRKRDAFLKRLEASLKRLQVDQVDLLHIHSLGRNEDLDAVEAPDGALKGLLEARDQKMTRFIGMTSHTDGAVLARAIERHPLNCVQMALNPSRNGRFEELALPAARGKNLGIIAMKVTGQEFLLKQQAAVGVDSLLRYSLSLPVTAAVIGMPALEFIDRNTEIAEKFSPLSSEDMDRLRGSFESLREPMERRLVGHLDGPTQLPGSFWA